MSTFYLKIGFKNGIVINLKEFIVRTGRILNLKRNSVEKEKVRRNSKEWRKNEN
jgi:hypothetical protein